MTQSATFKSIYIDVQTNTNPPKIWWQHMHYVALSRVTSLPRLYLKDLKEKICKSPQVVKYLENARQQSTIKLSYNLLCSYNSKTLKVIYNNTKSYKRHYDDIKDNYDILAADIVFLAETWLTSHDNTEKYSITNFNAYQLDQHGSSKRYHGLIVYVHKNSQVMDITLFPGAATEGICITVKKFPTVFTIIEVYIHPQTKSDQLYAFVI